MRVHWILKRLSLLVVGLLFTSQGYSHGLHSYDELMANLPPLHTIQSSHPDEARNFRVHLPVSYESLPNENFPVLYVLDADRPFVFQETINAVNTLVDRHKIPELLIVFIPNTTNETRTRDYTPSEHADQFLDFIEFELIPYIESNFRTEPLRIYSGHSRSGLLGIYSLLNRPHLFRAHLALSPALWHDDDLMIEQARSILQSMNSLPNFLYMNIGGEENENITNSFDRMAFILRRYAPSDLNWQADLAEFESHGTTRPLGHYLGLRKYFRNWDKPWNDIPTFDVFDEMGGLDMILSRYQNLSEEIGYTVKPLSLLDAGRYYLAIREAGEAIRILVTNAEFYPNSFSTYLELSRAYEAQGDIAAAIDAVNEAEAIARSTNNREEIERVTVRQEELRNR